MLVLQAAGGAVRLADEAIQLAMLSRHRVGMNNGRSRSAKRLQDEEAGDREPDSALKKRSHHRIVRDGDETAARRHWSKKAS